MKATTKPVEVDFDKYCEKLFWEYDSELKDADSKRMLFKSYMAKAASFNDIEPVSPLINVDDILYWGSEELSKMSEVIECEEDSASFVSMGGVNGVFSRMRRAFSDKEYRDHLLPPEVTESE